MTATIATVGDLSPQQVEQFHAQGYLVVDHLLTADQVQWTISRFEPLFNTQFETGIYPDEWYGRPGLSQSNATQQMTGLWRCDRALASLTLSARIARLNAQLMGWSVARYGLDTCWLKPPQAPAVSFHCNNTYVATLDPPAV
ncbi:MAG: phytanoyl-CoA dioxygenase family protein, partial [Cyanobacteria bacterium J06632_22]